MATLRRRDAARLRHRPAANDRELQIMIHHHPLYRLQAGGKSSGVRISTRPAKSSRPTQSTSARGKSSIIPTPTETPPIATSGSQDASDADNSYGSSYTLKGRELVQEALKIVNNADSAELMILELMDKHSFNLHRLKELLRGRLITPLFITLSHY